MTPAAARAFAENWIAAWNSHELESVLEHYTEDFEMNSPFIQTIAGNRSGRLKGKAEVAAYWAAALKKLPDLNFELLDVYAGASSVSVRYRSVLGLTAIETFEFEENGKVRRAMAHYDRFP